MDQIKGERTRETLAVLAAPEPNAQLADSPHVALVEGSRATGERVDFASDDGRFLVGAASYEAATLRLDDWPVDEFMLILGGEVEITAAGGEPRTYAAGDGFVMPRGFCGIWRTVGGLRKIAVAYRPPKQ